MGTAVERDWCGILTDTEHGQIQNKDKILSDTEYAQNTDCVLQVFVLSLKYFLSGLLTGRYRKVWVSNMEFHLPSAIPCTEQWEESQNCGSVVPWTSWKPAAQDPREEWSSSAIIIAEIIEAE